MIKFNKQYLIAGIILMFQGTLVNAALFTISNLHTETTGSVSFDVISLFTSSQPTWNVDKYGPFSNNTGHANCLEALDANKENHFVIPYKLGETITVPCSYKYEWLSGDMGTFSFTLEINEAGKIKFNCETECDLNKVQAGSG